MPSWHATLSTSASGTGRWPVASRWTRWRGGSSVRDQRDPDVLDDERGERAGVEDLVEAEPAGGGVRALEAVDDASGAVEQPADDDQGHHRRAAVVQEVGQEEDRRPAEGDVAGRV